MVTLSILWVLVIALCIVVLVYIFTCDHKIKKLEKGQESMEKSLVRIQKQLDTFSFEVDKKIYKLQSKKHEEGNNAR